MDLLDRISVQSQRQREGLTVTRKIGLNPNNRIVCRWNKCTTVHIGCDIRELGVRQENH